MVRLRAWLSPVVHWLMCHGFVAQQQGNVQYTPMGAEQVKQSGPSDGALIFYGALPLVIA